MGVRAACVMHQAREQAESAGTTHTVAALVAGL